MRGCAITASAHVDGIVASQMLVGDMAQQIRTKPNPPQDCSLRYSVVNQMELTLRFSNSGQTTFCRPCLKPSFGSLPWIIYVKT